jgi:hypothetical protein
MTTARRGNTAGTARRSVAKSPAAAPADANRMMTLFTVQFRHDFYNAANGKCADFAVVPSDESAALMTRLGMQYRDQGDGFSVYIPQSRIPAMMDMIVANYCPDAAGRGYWTRLTFFMILKNTDFVGITALPIDTSPTAQNLYASNLKIAKGPAGLSLGGGSGLGAAALRPITNGRVALPARGSGVVTAFDIAGKPVASVDVKQGTPTTLSLAGLPEGLYTIAGSPRAAYGGPAPIAYVPASPLTSGMIDLLLTQPNSATGIPEAFPIATPPAPPPAGYVAPATVPQTVNLIAQFAARETYWHYYVVPQSSRGAFTDDLAIAGKDMQFLKSTDVLPNGDTAVLFSATSPLPMRQRAPYRFSLTGQRRGSNGSRDTITVDHLPGAPAAPVWPAAAGDPLTGDSEIYVYV